MFLRKWDAPLKSFIRTERDARQVKKALAVKLIYQD
jgi:hypothetical protein